MCDYPEFYNVTNPRARKDRKCNECCGPILKGEKYVRHSGKWEGSVSSFCMCEMCGNLYNYVLSQDFDIEDGTDDCGNLIFGSLKEAVHQFPEIPIEMIPKRLLNARVQTDYRELYTFLDLTLEEFILLRPQLWWVDKIYQLFKSNEDKDWSFFTKPMPTLGCTPKVWMFKNAEDCFYICEKELVVGD